MRKTVWGLVLLLLVTVNAAAQTTEGSIRGFIHDEQGGVLPGVSITATSAQNPNPLTGVTDDQGGYRLINVPPGTYNVAAELQGFQKLVRTDLVLHAGLTIDVDLVMKVGAVSETIQVRGDAPLIETKSAVQSVSVTGETVQALPLGPQKHWSEFIRFTPGAISSDATNNQAPVFYIHGSGIVSESTLMDGADMTSAINPWLGYTGLPTDTVADVQLKTSGLDAAAPLGMGLAANVITKSGTNALHGSGTYTSAPGSWVGNNVTGGTASSAGINQPEFAVGGPVVADKAWFFGLYRYRGGFLGINRPASQVTAMQALSPGFVPFNNEFNNANIIFVKMDAKLSSIHQFSSFFNRDSTPYGSNGTFNTGDFVHTNIGGEGFSMRLTSAWNNWIATRAGVFVEQQERADLDGERRPDVVEHLPDRGALGRTAGRHHATGDQRQRPERDGIALHEMDDHRRCDDVPRTARDSGRHVPAPHMVRKDVITYANNGFALEEFALANPNNPAGGLLPFHERIYQAGTGTLDLGHFSDNAVYVQDAWRPTQRVTVNAGIRLDRVYRYDDLFNVQLQKSWEIGPRLGLNYLVTEDARNSLRASWMRLADAATINNFSASGSGTQGSGSLAVGYTDYYSTAMDGKWNASFVTPASTSANPTVVPDPNYHQPWVNEFALGFRHQFAGQWYGDIGYVYREYKDRTALVETNGIYNGNVFQGYKNVSQNAINSLTNNIWNWPVYKALEMVAAKQTAKYQLAVQLHAGLSASGRHVAAERPGVVHPAGRVRVRQGTAEQRQSHREQRQRPRHHGGRTEQHRVDDADRPRQPGVPRAVRHQSLGQLHLPERPLLGADLHENRRAGSAVRTGHRHALQRTRRRESAGDHGAVCQCDAQRRSVRVVAPAVLQFRVGKEFPLPRSTKFVVNFDMFNLREPRELPGIPLGCESALQLELRPRRNGAAAAQLPAGAAVHLLIASA